MNCPSDGTTLLMSERQGIEIDYCAECRGVWLDRGELDKILERAQAESDALTAPVAPAAQQPQHYAEQRYTEPRYDDKRYDERRDPRYDSRNGSRNDPRSGYKKKKSPFDFIGELFE